MHRHPVSKSCSLPSRVAIFLIRGYQYLISPWLKPSCRFSPTCSQFGIEAFREHGVIRGGYLLIKRLCCCHPFHLGGHDPVPPSIKDKKDL